jgi:hypothetical protein
VKRFLPILFLASCHAGAVRQEDPLERIKQNQLIGFTHQAQSIPHFRAFYELEDRSTNQGVLFEIAYDSSGFAKMGYPGKFDIYLKNGIATAFLDRSPESWYQIEYQKAFEKIHSEYAPVLRSLAKLCPTLRPDLPGEILFDVGRWENLSDIQNLPASIRLSLFPGRFGWLIDLEDPAYKLTEDTIFRRDGNGRSTASVEVELLKNGFLKRVQILPPTLLGKGTHPGITFTLKQLILTPPPHEIFETPDKGKRTDLTRTIQGQLRGRLANELEKTIFRALLQKYRHPLSEKEENELTDIFTLLYHIDLQATHDLQGMIALIKEGLEKMVTFAKKEVQGNPRREEILTRYRAEMDNQFETNRNHMEKFERRVKKEYRSLLKKILRDFSVPKALEQDLETLSLRGVEQAIEKDLRIPVRMIYEAKVKRLPPR